MRGSTWNTTQETGILDSYTSYACFAVTSAAAYLDSIAVVSKCSTLFCRVAQSDVVCSRKYCPALFSALNLPACFILRGPHDLQLRILHTDTRANLSAILQWSTSVGYQTAQAGYHHRIIYVESRNRYSSSCKSFVLCMLRLSQEDNAVNLSSINNPHLVPRIF